MALLALLLFSSLLVQSAPEGAVAVPEEGRAAQTPAPWAHETSDLPVDARIHYGSFDNGLRYAWANNPEPQERVYIRLHVDAGSMAETESEQGMAHFLEHMAFNGSKNFAAGTLIEWFQEHGMAFGADTNAHTSFSETVYKLDLPNRDEETLHEGLVVLRDFADGLLLAEAEVQNEKGVIDGEQRERDSASYRTFKQVLDRLYDGTRYPSRMPIGTKPVRDAFTAKSVRTFYETWYRPENMTLVVVGDLRELDPVPLLAEVFGDMQGPGTPVAPEPSHGTPSMKELSFAIYDAELPSVQISLSQLRPFVERPDTIAQRRADMTKSIAYQMLNLRFSEKLKQPGTPYLSARVGAAGGFEVFEGGDLTLDAEPAKWEAAMTDAIVELRTALEFGFQAAELDEVRAAIQRGLEEAVEREATAPSAGLREAILAEVEDEVVPTSAATDLRVIGPALEALTVEDCLAALREDWATGATSITAAGSLELEAAEEAFARVHATAFAVELEAPAAIEAKQFAYSKDPEAAGEVRERRHIEDLDVWLVEFENGVRVNIKATDFKERQLLVRARLGGGKLGMSESELVTAELAGPLFSAGGLEEHSADDLRRLLAGKQVGVGLSIEDDHLELGGGTTREDLALELELLCAFIEHPGYRPDLLSVLRAQLPLAYEQYAHTPQGPIAFEFLPKVLVGNPRASVLGMGHTPSLEQLLSIDMAAVERLLAPQLADGPLELTLIGDLEIEEAIELCARTVGTLSTRGATAELEGARKGAKLVGGVELSREIDTRDEKATVLMLFPTTDGSDTPRRRNLFFLGQVVNDRLRLEVRERLGAAYSPFAASEASRIYEDVGALMIQANGEPHQVEELVAACKAVGAALAEGGVSKEEVVRLAEPLQTQLRDMQRDNGYWMNALDAAQSQPESLDEYRGLVAFYANLDPEALSGLAKRFLSPENASTLVVLPEGTSESDE
jgi:zinc protease